MKIAIDKNSLGVKESTNEYIYLFDNEKLEELKELNIHCLHYTKCDYVDINLTDYEIECRKKAKITDKDWKILPKKKNNKIGIIVPNYNYGNMLEHCLSTIAIQTYKNYEVIFVDDMSTDNSVEVASKYVDKLTNIKIVELKQKRYNGGARNEAYLHLSDDVDYVWYVDSDDWLLNENVLEKINNKLQNNPDVLFVGMSQYKDNKLTTCYIPQYNTKYEALKGWSGSCGKVIKKSLATRQECLYNEGTLKEDKNHHYKVGFYMKTFELLKEPVYVWNRQNSKSVTTIRDKILWGTSTIRHYADTLQLAMTYEGQDLEFDRLMQERLRLTKQEMESGSDRQW